VTRQGAYFYTYVYHAVGFSGPVLKKLEAKTDMPSGCEPISVHNGEVCVQSASGGIEKIPLQTHEALISMPEARRTPPLPSSPCKIHHTYPDLVGSLQGGVYICTRPSLYYTSTGFVHGWVSMYTLHPVRHATRTQCGSYREGWVCVDT